MVRGLAAPSETEDGDGTDEKTECETGNDR
jgi:hypothetical protein